MRWYRPVKVADDMSQPQQMQEELKQKEDKPVSSPGQKPLDPLPDQKKDVKRLIDTGGLPGKAKEIFRDMLTRAGPIHSLHDALFEALGQYPGALDRFKSYLKLHPQGETADMERKRELGTSGKAAPVIRAPAPGMGQGPRATMPGGQAPRATMPGGQRNPVPGKVARRLPDRKLPEAKAEDAGQVSKMQRLQELDAAMERLDQVSRTVLEKRYGLGGGEPMTLQQIATELNLSPERIRQLEYMALMKLRVELTRARSTAASGRWGIARQAQQPEGEKFAPGEDPSKFGTPAVDIVGDKAMEFSDIPGVKGHVNLNVSVAAVKEALESAFGSDYFSPITTIRVTSLPGKFGQAVSTEPHTIYINAADMVSAVHRAVENEAAKASQTGIEAEMTAEVGDRINREIARLLWETIPHERQHAVDFQEQLNKMFSGGQGSVSSVSESHGEQAGKSALGRFRWYGQ
jgi:RNA polymerase sigma factor (sigma-70 family)